MSIGPASSLHPDCEIWFGFWTWMSLRVFPLCQPLFTKTTKLLVMNNSCLMQQLKVRTCPNLRWGPLIGAPNRWVFEYG